MTITSARLQNYRSYVDSSFEFEPHVNIIVGPNASGKTNLLDALYFVATGRSMKLTKEHIIRTKADWARVDLLTSENAERVLKIKVDETRPEYVVEDKTYKRLPFDQKIPVVLFEPNHLYLITTSPELRRQYLDDILDKTDPEFTKIKNTYIRTLRQRNSLLKLPLHQVQEQVFAWDIRLCDVAGRYVQKRLDLLKRINAHTDRVYSEIASKNHTLKLSYESKTPTDNYASSLLKQLQQNLEKDQLRGFTGNGPHRDDVAIRIDDNDMRDTASRGETRSILLSLKIIEAETLEEIHSKKPILLLDDVFGELDGSRRKNLINFIKQNQTFITTTDADVITHDFVKSATILAIKTN